MNTHDRAAVGKYPVFEVERGARAFEQRLGDEKAKTETGGFTAGIHAPPLARSHIGFTDAVHDFRRKARSVVADGHRNIVAAPIGRDLDAFQSKIDGVFEQVAEAV